MSSLELTVLYSKKGDLVSSTLVSRADDFVHLVRDCGLRKTLCPKSLPLHPGQQRSTLLVPPGFRP